MIWLVAVVEFEAVDKELVIPPGSGLDDPDETEFVPDVVRVVPTGETRVVSVPPNDRELELVGPPRGGPDDPDEAEVDHVDRFRGAELPTDNPEVLVPEDCNPLDLDVCEVELALWLDSERGPRLAGWVVSEAVLVCDA